MIHISFDLDGTILDSHQSVAHSFINALKLHDITAPIELEVGPTLDELISKYVKGTVDKRQNVRADFIKLYDNEHAISAPLYPGIVGLLHTLKSDDHYITLVTNKREIPTRRILEKHKLGDFFQVVVCADQSSFGVTKAARLKNIKHTNMKNIYVGDTKADQIAARTAGYNFFHAKWGYEDFITEDSILFPHELLKFIDA